LHRKGLVIGILILLIGVNIGSSFAGDVDVKTMSSVGFDGNTLYVGGSGANNYTTIQSAVDDAVDGDIVFVFYGVYNENIILNKELTIIGIENPDGQIPLLDKYDKVVIVIKKDNCTIQNFEIRTGEDAIRLESDNNHILNCIVSDAVKDLNLQSDWD